MTDQHFLPPPPPDIEYEEPARQPFDLLLCTCGHLFIAHRAYEGETGTRCQAPVPLVNNDGAPAGFTECPCSQVEPKAPDD